MGPENLKPLDEIKSLDEQIGLTNDLAGLKPIFFRLDEIAKQHSNDFEVQLAAGEAKQHLVNRGTKLKQMKEAGSAAPIAAEPAAASPSPASPSPLIATPASPGERTAAPPSIKIPPPPPAPPPLPEKSLLATTESTAASLPSPPPPLPSGSGPVGIAGATGPLPSATLPSQRVPAPVLPPRPPAPPVNWKRALWVGGIAGIIVAAAGIAALVNARKHRGANAGAIAVSIATTPPGASVRVTSAASGEMRCTSDCQLSLAPGTYQVTAFLDGYEPAASAISLAPGQPSSVSLSLEPQAQSLRILTDLSQGTVQIDNQPPADLQEGQYIVDRIAPGAHTAKIVAKTGEASFSFQVTAAKLPEITGPVTVKNLNAVLVSSLGNQAHVVTNAGPLKLTVNGQPEADATPTGVDLKSFQAGVDEIALGEGKDQRSMKESFGPAPMLTAFFKSDLNIGTLIVSTQEDGVSVFVNDKIYRRKTQRGQVRIQTAPGTVTVRVAKDGFDPPPPQMAEIKKGGETRLEFTLKPTPKFSSLQISGGTPGAQVLIDQKPAGLIGADGNFNNGSIAPGDHTIELTRDHFVAKRLQRSFKAGQTVALSGADVILAAERIIPPPEKKPEPPPVQKAVAATPKPGTMADWEDNGLWKQENGVWMHRGAGFLAYKMTPKGVFTFTVELLKGGSLFHGGKVRWCVNYIDSKNYALYEIDSKNFVAEVVQNGKKFERTKTPLKDLDKQKSFTIQIDVTPEHVVHRLFAGGEWVNLDSWAETGRNFSQGKFGFLVQGDDEIGLTDFKFQPK